MKKPASKKNTETCQRKMNKSLVFTNGPTGYKKLICPNTIAMIEIPFAISTDNERFSILTVFQYNA